ncbi:MAG: polysaccharide biosynthesis/export family protein [Cyanobacteria bacterium P01_H01_bin.105]
MLQLSYSRLRAAMPLVLGVVCVIPTTAIAQTLQTLPPAEPAANESVSPTPSRLNLNTVPLNYAAASSYLLGPGDRIEVSVYGFPEYTGPLSVLPDGTVALPIVGKVAAAGKTTDQLTQELRVILDRILVDPAVSVSLNSLRPIVVNVSGEVYRPGPLQLQETTNVNEDTVVAYGPPSISEALVEAGGVRRTADLRNVVVMRELPNGETVSTEINLWDALWSASLPEEMLLRDGDLVFVPRLAEGELVDSHLLARSSLAPDTVRVRVVGEVTRPGEVAVPPNSSLSSAVAIAGGPTDDARLKEVAFVRMNDETGEITQEVVDLRNLVDTYQIQDGDVVVVPKTTGGSVLDLAARLVNPLNFLLNLFN